MLIYCVLLAFIIIFGFIMFYKKEDCIEIEKKKRKWYIIIVFSILCIVMSLRSQKLGTDTYLYTTIFNNYSKMSWLDILSFKDMFIGFAIFNKLVSMVSTNNQAIIIGASVLICSLTGNFIYRNSKHVVYSTILFVLFYHYLNCFNIFRQYIAISIIINTLPLLLNKKIFKYILVCLLAISIHNTAIVALFLIPLAYIKYNKKSVIVYTIIMFFALLLIQYGMNIFSNFFPHYKMYFQEQYMKYSGLGLTILILIYVAISFLAFILRDKNNNEKDNRKFMMLLMINNIAIIANIMSYKFFILYRVSLYFSIFLIIFVPMVFERYKKNRLLLYFMFFIIMLIPFSSKLMSNDGQVVPYKTVLTDKSLAINYYRKGVI